VRVEGKKKEGNVGRPSGKKALRHALRGKNRVGEKNRWEKVERKTRERGGKKKKRAHVPQKERRFSKKKRRPDEERTAAEKKKKGGRCSRPGGRDYLFAQEVLGGREVKETNEGGEGGKISAEGASMMPLGRKGACKVHAAL